MAKKTSSPKLHVWRCTVESALMRQIFEILVKANQPMRQKDVVALIKGSKSANHVGNYMRRLLQYGVFEREKTRGLGTYYSFADGLKDFAESELKFYSEEKREAA